MKTLKEQILELKAAGKSYNQIQQELGCSKGTISFHCNESVRERVKLRKRCLKQGIPFEKKVERRGRRYCLNCNSEVAHPKIYCNNLCQQEYQFNQEYENWLQTGITKTRTWLRKALSKLHGYRCASCGLSDWNNRPITLEVDHIDGYANNSAIDNLQLICPNCHSQTNSYKGANKGKGRASLGMSPFGSY